jgi:hypothetical protein
MMSLNLATPPSPGSADATIMAGMGDRPVPPTAKNHGLLYLFLFMGPVNNP